MIAISYYGQKKDIIQKRVPLSIYTFNSIKTHIHGVFSIKKRLHLNSYKFVIVNANDLDRNMASIDFSTIGRKPSVFIYDDYKRYQNNNLLKGFLLKNDPTRCNLHCIENSVQPYLLNQ